MIELAAVGDPAAVPEAVAAVLGILQQPGLSLSDSVAAALEGRCRLLVFDNCEHVLNAAADIIESIIAAIGHGQDLATSREGLRLADEQLWPVPSLDVRAGVESSCGESLRRACSRCRTRQFADRLRARGCRGRDLSPPRRNPVGDRVGRLTHAVHDRHRAARSAR